MSTQRKPLLFDPLADKDSNIDRIWAGKSSDSSKNFSNYYDYYFSGEDIKVYIDGLFGAENELDIATFAYSIRQEKQPLYGFWSYNYDTVMLGTRIISGEITLFTRYPRRMTDLLEQAATARATSPAERAPQNMIVSRLYSNNGQILGSTQDERNIQKYWSYSQLDRITSDPAMAEASNKTIFSAHPPFNFVILYGIEEVSSSPFPATMPTQGGNNNVNLKIENNLDRMMYTDINQRTMKADAAASPMKIILQEVQLMNMSTVYTPGGQPVAESYQFIARDYYFTQADLSFIKRLTTSVVSDETTSEPSDTTPIPEETVTGGNGSNTRGPDIGGSYGYPGYDLSLAMLSSNAFVGVIQEKLGVYPIDGVFTGELALAVRDFQLSAGISPANGIVNRQTYEAILSIFNLNVEESFILQYPGTPINFGMENNYVKWIQSKLYLSPLGHQPFFSGNNIPYTETEEFGRFGELTRERVILFQSSYQISPADGVVDNITWNTLFRELSQAEFDAIYG